MTSNDEPVARASELAPGQTKRIERDGTAILLCNVRGTYHAIEDVCTHDGSDFEGADVDDECRIMCPRHGALFDVATGAALTLPAIVPLRTFTVRVAGDALFIEV